MMKEARKIVLAIGCIICAALAICESHKEPPPEVRVYVAPYTKNDSRAFDESLDVIGNYVKRSGDTMFGLLNFNGTAGISLNGSGNISLNGTGNINVASNSYTAIPFVARGNGMTRYASFGPASSELFGFYNTDFKFSVPLRGINGASSYLTLIGDSSANVQATAPLEAFALNYDTTNLRARVYEGQGGTAGWNMIPTLNPDGGFPYGALGTLSGYNAQTTAGTNSVIQQRFYSQFKPIRVGFTSQVAGTGAGTFTVEVRDVTGAATLCTSATTACTAAAGAITTSQCPLSAAGTSAAGSDILLRVTCGTCTTCPLGTVSTTYQTF